MRTLLVVLGLAASGVSFPARATGLDVGGLRTEYLVEPLAVEGEHPRLSWVLAARPSGARGQRQTAYQILVASDAANLAAGRGDLWDSGKVASDATIHVEYAGRALASRQPCHWKVRVWDKDDRPSGWSRPATWTIAPRAPDDFSARFVGGGPASNFPLLRRAFAVTGGVRRAVVHASARGLYELRLNGQRVGDHVLAPEWTDYRKRIQYQTYDVTKVVRSGANVVGAYLGNGWYATKIPTGKPYGPVPRLLVQIEIERRDGTTERVVTDSEWRFTDDGPVRSSGIYQGETVDVTRTLPGWDAPGFDDRTWSPVTVEPDLGPATLSAQPNEPMRVLLDLPARSVTEPAPGVYVLDFGQNLTGWVRARLQGPRGTVVTLRHAEALDGQGQVDMRSIAEAKPIETYTLGGSTDVFEPRFTYHGFRYVEVKGLLRRPAATAFVARSIRSDAPEVGTIETSNALVNQIIRAALWTQRDNLTGMLTDCPQRFERLGWLGDGQSYSQSLIFNADVAALLTKWLRDIRDDQHPDGGFPDWTPTPPDMSPGYRATYYGAAGWGDGGVILPWRLYQNYADRRALAEHYDAAKRFVDWLEAANPDGLRVKNRGKDWGDWMSNPPMPKDAFATAWYAHSADLLSRMARVLGHTDDEKKYKELFERIRRAFNQKFVDAEGRVACDCQSGYALALHFDLLSESGQARAREHLLKAIERADGHVGTGFHTTSRMFVELSRRGASAAAYRMLLQRTAPSWGYMIGEGATTFWEHWQGWSRAGGFNPAARSNLSLNHASLGAVVEWLWRGMVGINGDDERPGFKHVVIRPQPHADLAWVKGRYASIRGPIVSKWQSRAGRFDLAVDLPPGTTGTVYIPTADVASLRESGKAAKDQPGVRFVREETGAAVFEIESGRYRFSAK